MAYLVLVRHGESEWNKKGLWSGLTDTPLNEKGKKEAFAAGKMLSDIHFDIAFTSQLIRTKQTLTEILKALNIDHISTNESQALSERNYGDYTGKNKWDVKNTIGEEQFLKLRKSWDFPIPNGESLKDVSSRIIPYYQSAILPLLRQGKNVLVISSHAPLRALVKYLEAISDEQIFYLEIATGVSYIYEINEDGIVVSKKVRGERENTV